MGWQAGWLTGAQTVWHTGLTGQAGWQTESHVGLTMGQAGAQDGAVVQGTAQGGGVHGDAQGEAHGEHGGGQQSS